ncbi:unnamed protein product [Urochloa humidicola]
MSLFALSCSLVPFIVLLLLCRRHRKIQRESRLLSRQRYREEAIREREAKRSLRRSRYRAYFEQQLLTSTDDVAKRKESLQAIESLDKWGLVRAGIHHRDLHGMDRYEIEVLEFLEQHGHGAPSSLLGISGKRGVGKSTLLWLVRSAYGIWNDSFDFIFLFDAGSAGFTAGELRDALARNIGLDPSSSSPATDFPVAQMVSILFRDSSFLLLLDDVRDVIDLSAAGLPMPLGRRQKVVFTTRDQAICAKMGCASSDTIQMQCLGEDAAWDLFRYCVGNGIISANPRIAKKIVAECRGFPSALRTVGLSMSTSRYLKEWMSAYELITTKGPQADMDDEDYPCLHFFEQYFWDSLFTSSYPQSWR